MRRQPARFTAPRSVRGVWLSLFAMLLIFAGPLVSQSMDHHRRTPAAVAMPDGMSAAGHGQHVGAHAEPRVADHALWAKCGYCTLLFSCPALPTVVALIIAAPPRPADFFVPTAQQGHARHAIFPNARSRAPPLLTTV